MLIGIAGGKQVGKTTLGNLLAEKYTLRHVSFATPLRRFICDVLGATDEELEAHKETPIAWLDGITPRYMMQTLGTDLARKQWHPDIWVRVAMRKAISGRRAVISDVRFPNEAEAIHRHGGSIIRLSRENRHVADSHESEQPLDGEHVDHEIDNNSTIDELLAHAERFLFGPDGVKSRTVILKPEMIDLIEPHSADAAVDELLPPMSAPGEE